MAQKQNQTPYMDYTGLGYETTLAQRGVRVDEYGRPTVAPTPKDASGKSIDRNAPVSIEENPFFGGLVATKAVEMLPEVYDDYIKTASGIYESVSPLAKKDYDEMSTIGKIAATPAALVGGVQRGGLELATGTIPSIVSAVREKAAEDNWVAQLHAYSKEDSDSVMNFVQSLENMGLDAQQMAQVNLDEIKIPVYNKEGGIEKWETPKLTDSQKALFSDYQTLLTERQRDAMSRKTKQLLGEELDGKFFAPWAKGYSYRQFSVFNDLKSSDAGFIPEAAETVGEMVPETALMGLAGVGAAAATAKAVSLAGRAMAERAAAKVGAKYAAKAVAGQALKGVPVSIARQIAIENRVANMVMARIAKPSAALSMISAQTAVFSQSFARGYEDMRAYALSKGLTFQEANSIGMENGFWNGISECLEFNAFAKALNSKGLIRTYINNIILPEGIQEASQTLGEIGIKIGHGLDQYKFEDIVLETVTAFSLGMIGGGIFGLGTGVSGRLIDMQRASYIAKQKREFAKKYGREMTEAEEKEARATAAINNATAVAQKNAEEIKKTQEKVIKAADKKIAEAKTEEEKQKAQKTKETIIKAVNEFNSKEKTQTKEEQDTAKQFLKDNKIKEPKLLDPETTNLEYKLDKGELEETQRLAEEEVIEETRKEVAAENSVGEKTEPAQKEAKPIAFKSGLIPEEAREIAGEQFKLYATRHLQANPNATNLEIRRGWAATLAVIKAYGTNDFVKSLENIGDLIIDNINANSNYAKAQSIALDAKFNGLLTPETIKGLMSSNPAERTDAKWKLAKDSIIRDFEDFGSKETGKLVAELFENLNYDYSVLYGTDPVDLYMQSRMQMIDLSRARLNNQLSKIGLSTILDSIKKQQAATDQDVLEYYRKALEVVNAFEVLQKIDSGAIKDKSGKDKALATINNVLFGTSDTITDYNEILNSLWTRATQEGNIYSDMNKHSAMPLKVSNGGIISVPTMPDFMAMAIMREMGFSQKQISFAFGLNAQQATIKKYNDSVARLYPELSEAELKPLKQIAKEIRTDKGLREIPSTRYPEKAQVSAFYDPARNLIATTENLRNGQLGHEAVHWLVTNVIMKEANLVANGLPGNARVRNLLGQISDKYGRHIGDLTSAEFQETVIDALFDILDNKSKRGPRTELEKAYDNMKHELNLVLRHPEKSAYPKFQNSKKQVKSDFQKAIYNLFSEDANQDVFDRAEELERLSYRGKKADIINSAMSILANHEEIPDAQEWKFKFEQARQKATSLIEAANLARKFAVDARVYAIAKSQSENFDKVIDNAGRVKWMPKKSTFDEKVMDAEMRLMNFSLAALYPSSRTGKALTIGDMGNPWEDVRRNWKEIAKSTWTETKSGVADLWHTVSGSLYADADAISPQLGALIRDTMWERLEANKQDANLVNNLKDLILKHKDIKMTGSDSFAEFETILWSGYDHSRQDAEAWLMKNLGEEDGAKAIKALEALQKRFSDYVERLHEDYGIDIDLSDDSYFPRVLKDKEGFARHMGFSNFISEIQKIERKYIRNEISETQKIDLINSIGIRNNATSMTALHNRTNVIITQDQVPFYDNIFESATKYMQSMTNTIMMRELFGRLEHDEQGRPMGFYEDTGKKYEYDYEFLMNQKSGRVGILLSQLLFDGKVDAEKLSKFEKSSKAFALRERSTNKLVDSVLTLNTMTQLTQLVNTANQFGEMLPTAIRFGAKDSLKSGLDIIMSKDNKDYVTLEDMFAEDTELDLLSPQYGKKVTKFAQKWTGFLWADALMKETAAKSGLKYITDAIPLFDREYESLTEEEKEQHDNALSYIQRTLGIDERLGVSAEQKDRYNKLLDALKNKDYKQIDVRKLARTILTETQPIDAASRPIASNSQNPLVKAAYLFKTVGARQASFLGQYLFHDAKTNPKKFAKRLTNFVLLALLFGLPREAIIDILRNRKPDLDVADSITEPFFINRYVREMAKKDGFASAAGKMAGWDVPIINHLSKSIMNLDGRYMLISVPVIGYPANDLIGRSYEANKKKNIALVETF